MNEILKIHSHLGSQGFELCDQEEIKTVIGDSLPYGFVGLYKLTGWYAALVKGITGFSLVNVEPQSTTGANT